MTVTSGNRGLEEGDCRMRALHRLLVTGAFGGLAAATMASSGAFACSPTARVWVSGVGPEPDPLPAVITPVSYTHLTLPTKRIV